MVAALFKSVCPGAIRRRRAPSATVMVISGPASDLSTRLLPLIDFTTPTFLATALVLLCAAPASCAIAGVANARAAPSAQTASDSAKRIANVLLLVTNQNSPSYRVSKLFSFDGDYSDQTRVCPKVPHSLPFRDRPSIMKDKCE